MNTIEAIKQDIIERLNDYKGGNYYGADLAYTLFEGENVNGSVFCNTYKTKEYIKENFDLFGDFLEDYHSQTGEQLNPFAEPEKCHVIFLLEAASRILGQCKTVNDNWNNIFELNQKSIKKVTKEVAAFDGNLF